MFDDFKKWFKGDWLSTAKKCKNNTFYVDTKNNILIEYQYFGSIIPQIGTEIIHNNFYGNVIRCILDYKNNKITVVIDVK